MTPSRFIEEVRLLEYMAAGSQQSPGPECRFARSRYSSCRDIAGYSTRTLIEEASRELSTAQRIASSSSYHRIIEYIPDKNEMVEMR